MLNQIGDVLISRLLMEPQLEEVSGTVTLKPLNVRRFAQLLCALEAGEFYNRHLYRCPYFQNYLVHLVFAAQVAMKLGEGLFLEFGVASGTTIGVIAQATQGAVVGFDSFEGLPEDWRDGAREGAFAGRVPAVPDGVSLRVGMIEEQLPRFLGEGAQEIRFIHVDTDLYSSARFILESCVGRMNDTVIVFDEFYNYPGWRDHEHKAWCEFQAAHGHLFDVQYLGLGGEAAVSVRVTRKGVPAG